MNNEVEVKLLRQKIQSSKIIISTHRARIKLWEQRLKELYKEVL